MADKKSGIDQALIRDLANILNDTDLSEIEVEHNALYANVFVSSASGAQGFDSEIIDQCDFMNSFRCNSFN